MFLLIFGQFSACLDFTACVKQTSKIPEFFLEEQAPQKTQGPFLLVFAVAPQGAVSNSDVTSRHCQALLKASTSQSKDTTCLPECTPHGSHAHICCTHTYTVPTYSDLYYIQYVYHIYPDTPLTQHTNMHFDASQTY